MTVIKPLVWGWDAGDGGAWEVDTPFGWLSVQPAMDGVTWCWVTPTHSKFGFQTADAAMASVEAWWDAAVTKCLTRTEEVPR